MLRYFLEFLKCQFLDSLTNVRTQNLEKSICKQPTNSTFNDKVENWCQSCTYLFLIIQDNLSLQQSFYTLL
jgi:hypothetical protein